jgi:hypothetical protein
MAKDVVYVDSINFIVAKFEVKEFASFLEFTLVIHAWWTKAPVLSNINNHIYNSMFQF